MPTIEEKKELSTEEKIALLKKELEAKKAEADAKKKAEEEAKKTKAKPAEPVKPVDYKDTPEFKALVEANNKNSTLMDKFAKLFKGKEDKPVEPAQQNKTEIQELKNQINLMKQENEINTITQHINLPDHQKQAFSILIKQKATEGNGIKADDVDNVLKSLGYVKEEPKKAEPTKTVPSIAEGWATATKITEANKPVEPAKPAPIEKSGAKLKGGGDTPLKPINTITVKEFNNMSMADKAVIFDSDQKLFDSLKKQAWKDAGFTLR